jgi:hypothetical protein
MTQAREATINKSISDREVIDHHISVEMMKRPHLWIHGQRLLPLVRKRTLYPQTSEGVMIAKDDQPPFRVYLGNLFALAALGAIGGDAAKTPVPFIHYDSAEECAADGWEVD